MLGSNKNYETITSQHIAMSMAWACIHHTYFLEIMADHGGKEHTRVIAKRAIRDLGNLCYYFEYLTSANVLPEDVFFLVDLPRSHAFI